MQSSLSPITSILNTPIIDRIRIYLDDRQLHDEDSDDNHYNGGHYDNHRGLIINLAFTFLSCLGRCFLYNNYYF